MKKQILFILILSAFKFYAQNFELKNIGGAIVWFSLGDKNDDPIKYPFEMLKPGQSVKRTINMKAYPELLVSNRDAENTEFVTYYSLAPERVQEQNLLNKTMFLTVQVVTYVDKLTKQGITYPLVEPQRQGYFSGYFNKNYNVTAAELEKFRMPYKKQSYLFDLEKSAYNTIASVTDRVNYPPTPFSNPFEILGVSEHATVEMINDQYNLILKKIEFLKAHPDQQPLYDKIVDILNTARQDALLEQVLRTKW